MANSRWITERGYTVLVEWAQYPFLVARRIKASIRLRSAELANPHQAGAVYVSLSSAVYWKIACRVGRWHPVAATDAQCVEIYCTVLLFVSVGCQVWTSQQGINFADGQWYLAYSVQDCQSGCAITPGCTGLDWVSTASLGQQCWLSGTWSGAQGAVSGVTHYFYNPLCTGTF